jgi:hypothetical protein
MVSKTMLGMKYKRKREKMDEKLAPFYISMIVMVGAINVLRFLQWRAGNTAV